MNDLGHFANAAETDHLTPDTRPFYDWARDADRARSSAEIDGGDVVMVLHVTELLVAEHNATILPPGPSPRPGWYVVDFEELFVYTYNDEETAVNDYMTVVAEFADDDGPFADGTF